MRDPTVLITDSRAVLGGKTYAMVNTPSVTEASKSPNLSFAIVCLLVDGSMFLCLAWLLPGGLPAPIGESSEIILRQAPPRSSRSNPAPGGARRRTWRPCWQADSGLLRAHPGVELRSIQPTNCSRGQGARVIQDVSGAGSWSALRTDKSCPRTEDLRPRDVIQPRACPWTAPS